MHHPVHAEKRAKSCCIGLKELRGEGSENFLQPLMGCTHHLVVEGNWLVECLDNSYIQVDPA